MYFYSHLIQVNIGPRRNSHHHHDTHIRFHWYPLHSSRPGLLRCDQGRSRLCIPDGKRLGKIRNWPASTAPCKKVCVSTLSLAPAPCRKSCTKTAWLYETVIIFHRWRGLGYPSGKDERYYSDPHKCDTRRFRGLARKALSKVKHLAPTRPNPSATINPTTNPTPGGYLPSTTAS